MPTDTVIEVQGLSKLYRLGTREQYQTLRDALSRAARSVLTRSGNGAQGQVDRSTLWALKDVTFNVNQGDIVGIIGHNGAGKSTLLKILSRITAPTEGRVVLDGRVGSLLEVGTGFHPELTGRENVFLNGAILGMKRSEIDQRFDEIVAFAGVEQFIDTPVKRYSSGMYLRLAFAVAVHLETEILMVDEVLAVGDAAFQLKCLNRMSEVSQSGRTILFVSHNLEAVSRLCNRGILLKRGAIAKMGSPKECIDEYLATSVRHNPVEGAISLVSHSGRTKNHGGPVRLSAVRVADQDGKSAWAIGCGEHCRVEIEYELFETGKPQNVTFAVTFSNSQNHRIASCRSHDTHVDPIRVDRSGMVVCHIPKLPLVPGIYHLNLGCSTEAGFSDGIYDAAALEVGAGDFYPSSSTPPPSHGEALFEHQWEVQNVSMNTKVYE